MMFVIVASPPHSATSISEDCPPETFPLDADNLFIVKVESFATTGAAVRRGLIALACGHRGAPRITGKSFSQNNFR
jgi:hypothetical protein